MMMDVKPWFQCLKSFPMNNVECKNKKRTQVLTQSILKEPQSMTRSIGPAQEYASRRCQAPEPIKQARLMWQADLLAAFSTPKHVKSQRMGQSI